MELKEELINFAKWYQMDEMSRDEPEPFSEIVDRYLERFGKNSTKSTSNCNIPPVINTVCRCFNNNCFGWNKNNTCKSDSFKCKGRQTDL